MNSAALITMVLTQVTVISFTAYFFLRVLRTPPKDTDED
ncbi:MAG: hypothetical protein RLY31_2568 [Bacteroidota bacterium]|jgi:hypothetical protein